MLQRWRHTQLIWRDVLTVEAPVNSKGALHD